jgi:hypothetical protein
MNVSDRLDALPQKLQIALDLLSSECFAIAIFLLLRQIQFV